MVLEDGGTSPRKCLSIHRPPRNEALWWQYAGQVSERTAKITHNKESTSPPPLPYLFDDNVLTEKWANKDNEISREKNLCNKPILRDDQAFVKHSACWSMRKK